MGQSSKRATLSNVTTGMRLSEARAGERADRSGLAYGEVWGGRGDILEVSGCERAAPLDLGPGGLRSERGAGANPRVGAGPGLHSTQANPHPKYRALQGGPIPATSSNCPPFAVTLKGKEGHPTLHGALTTAVHPLSMGWDGMGWNTCRGEGEAQWG